MGNPGNWIRRSDSTGFPDQRAGPRDLAGCPTLHRGSLGPNVTYKPGLRASQQKNESGFNKACPTRRKPCREHPVYSSTYLLYIIDTLGFNHVVRCELTCVLQSGSQAWNLGDFRKLMGDILEALPGIAQAEYPLARWPAVARVQSEGIAK